MSGKPAKFIPNTMLPANVAGAVARLLFSGRPLAVPGRVIAIVIDALNREPWRARPHVAQEGIKRGPAPANLDASSAVATKVRGAAVVAAIAHALPDLVFAGVRSPVRANNLNLKAAATAVPARPQIADKGKALFATGARTNVGPLFAALRTI